MSPSMMQKDAKEMVRKAKKMSSVKENGGKKMKASLQREEVKKSLKIAEMILQQETRQYSEDDAPSESDYVWSRKMDRFPVLVDKSGEDGGFEVDKGEDGIVKVKDDKKGNAGKVHDALLDTREKRPKVANSLRSLRLAIAAKMKKKQESDVSQILTSKGLASDDDE